MNEKHGLLWWAAVRAEVRANLRKEKGIGFVQSFLAASQLTEDDINLGLAKAAQQLGMAAPPPMPVGLGNGEFLQWIAEFLNSDLGKALIQILTALLLGLL